MGGRPAAGMQALRLRKQGQPVGCVTLALDDNLLLASHWDMPEVGDGLIWVILAPGAVLYYQVRRPWLVYATLIPAAAEVVLATNTQRWCLTVDSALY